MLRVCVLLPTMVSPAVTVLISSSSSKSSASPLAPVLLRWESRIVAMRKFPKSVVEDDTTSSGVVV